MGTVLKVVLGVLLGGLLLMGGCVALFGAASNEIGQEVDEQASERNEDARNDVTVTSCGQVGQFGVIEAGGTINNDSAERSTYAITIEFFDDAGTRVGEATSFNNAIAPGATAEFRASGNLPEGTAVANCGVADVTRFSAES